MFKSLSHPSTPVKKQSETDYALDMITHNLIGQGHLDVSNAHLLKSNEVKAQLKQMARSTTAGRVTVNPSTAPSTGKSVRISTPHKEKNSSPNPSRAKARVFTSASSQHNSSSSGNSKAKFQSRTALPVKKRSITSYRRTNNKPPPRKSSTTLVSVASNSSNRSGGGRRHSRPIAVTDSTSTSSTRVHKPLFSTKLDMRGFKTEEISLELTGNRLTITGTRARRDGLNARKATEIVEIPRVVDIGSLKIARKLDGMIVIQESRRNRVDSRM